ncbi:hypothetical protein BGZ81_003567 [Podila clonocystis]|nr:hypothetical protein BGZ81_003567 [Podila clonocystis]
MTKHSAVLLLGNAGAGKSSLLTQLGGTIFKSGAAFRTGFTKDIYEEWVMLNGTPVCLIDVPGLFESSEKETQFNAQKLTLALSRDYEYKLYFVMKADNRGPPDAEMVMMSKINESIKQVNGCRVSFRVIVNQIMSPEVYDMYDEGLAKDNFQSLFATLDIPGFSFDIKIDGVMLLEYDEEGLRNKKFSERVTQDVSEHCQSAIQVHKGIKVSNKELKAYQKAILALASPLILAGGAVASTGMLLVKAGKKAQKSLRRFLSS